MTPTPSALLFDLQGTTADFYTPVVRALHAAFPASEYPGVDHDDLLARWRAGYFDQTGAEAADDDWISVHAVYRTTLDEVLAEAGLVADDDLGEELTTTWQHLEPWPDSIEGLTRLRTRFTTATLSNADVAAAVRITKGAGLPFDAVFTAEMAGAFKPDPRAYLTAARYLDTAPARIMMVACHKYDLRAAATLGMTSAFVARPAEFGPSGSPDTDPDPGFTLNATDFIDLAEQLGC
ncbi:haloacid dehalogenase type II [Gordonia crocea]|uniref:Putative HAD-superfamily hydrolase YfnB n=1 Tax=Gordonia crocea TaxID=589162 RepID=A0A7M3SVE7_9ACTN|nr:haloacid dehalogenase type II [Gordonia crocea]GED96621.1 putative HAD-superfamily hydrolase YfnB [Gordonia crocea]